MNALYLYVAGFAAVLALIGIMRWVKLSEDGPEATPPPWWIYLLTIALAAAWPLLILIVIAALALEWTFNRFPLGRRRQ